MPSAVPISSHQGMGTLHVVHHNPFALFFSLQHHFSRFFERALPIFDSDNPCLGRRQASQSVLAKLVMTEHLGQNPPPQPPPSSFPGSVPPPILEFETDQHLSPLPPPVHDAVTSHPHSQPPVGRTPMPPAMRAVSAAINDLTDTPPNARSVNSTAPSSPRMWDSLKTDRALHSD